MKKNIGSADKVIRYLLAALILILAFTKVITGTLAIVLIVLAVVLVLTSLINFCPIWALLGIKTNKAKE